MHLFVSNLFPPIYLSTIWCMRVGKGRTTECAHDQRSFTKLFVCHSDLFLSAISLLHSASHRTCTSTFFFIKYSLLVEKCVCVCLCVVCCALLFSTSIDVLSPINIMIFAFQKSCFKYLIKNEEAFWWSLNWCFAEHKELTFTTNFTFISMLLTSLFCRLSTCAWQIRLYALGKSIGPSYFALPSPRQADWVV